MRPKKTDMGLLTVALLLIAVGGFAMSGAEIWLSRMTVSESQSLGGMPAMIIGGILMALGLFLAWESRK